MNISCVFKCSFDILPHEVPYFQKSKCIMTHALQSAFMWPCSWSRAVTHDPKLDVKNPQDCFRMQLYTYDEDESLFLFFSFLQQGCPRMISFKIKLVIYSWTKTFMYIIKQKFLYCITTMGCIIFGQETSRFLFQAFCLDNLNQIWRIWLVLSLYLL